MTKWHRWDDVQDLFIKISERQSIPKYLHEISEIRMHQQTIMQTLLAFPDDDISIMDDELTVMLKKLEYQFSNDN